LLKDEIAVEYRPILANSTPSLKFCSAVFLDNLSKNPIKMYSDVEIKYVYW
jgi:hypothetical protein